MLEEIEQLMRIGKWEEVFHRCRAALQINPTHPRLNAYIALCYMRGNQFEHAAQYFRKAVTLDENFFEAHLKLAQCLDRMQLFNEGLLHAKEAVRLRPNDPTAKLLMQGLERNATPEFKDGWERSEGPMFHNVSLSEE